MKKIVLCLIIFLSLTLLGFKEKEFSINLKGIEEVSEIQLNTAKISIQHFSKKRAIKLMDSIETVSILDEKDKNTIQNNGYYDTVSIIYNDKSRDIFYFFEVNDNWYMETSQGTIYKNADFITSYIEHVNITTKITLSLPSEFKLELNNQFNTLDLRYFLILEVKRDMENGISEEDAILYAKEKIITFMTIYQYALEEGYELSEIEYDQLMEKHLEKVESAENYKEIEKYYEEFGTTLKAFITKHKEYYKITDTIDNLYKIKCEEYRNGNDKINGRVCTDITEYWNSFLTEVVNKEAKKYDMSSFLDKLENAENYYWQYTQNN